MQMHYFGGFFYKMVIFLCHSAVCSVAPRLLFCGGKGIFLPCFVLTHLLSLPREIQGNTSL